MAMNVKDAKKEVSREITVRAGMEGYQDRNFILTLKVDRIEMREKGKIGTTKRLPYRDFLRWMFAHVPSDGV